MKGMTMITVETTFAPQLGLELNDRGQHRKETGVAADCVFPACAAVYMIDIRSKFLGK